jgi:hypothetical protein
VHNAERLGKAAICEVWRRRKHQLPEAQAQVCQAAFEIIRRGYIATHDRMQNRVELANETMRDALRQLHARGLIVHDPQRGGVVGAYGLSLQPTPHVLELDAVRLYTWCALDAVGIPAGLQEDAAVRGQCFHCQQELRVRYHAGQVTHVSAPALQVWIAVPDRQRSAVDET